MQVAKLSKDYAKRIPRTLVLGVDRLDYIKGIDLKLLAFAEALRRHPEFIGQLSLLQVAVPSREDVEEYQNLKQQVEQLVGKINGEFGKPGYSHPLYVQKHFLKSWLPCIDVRRLCLSPAKEMV